MSAVDIALPRLQTEEGFRATKYLDPNGLESIGYGFCIDRGISQFAASALLSAQAQERHDELMQFSWYAGCNPARQSVLLDIAFNTGVGGLLKFPHMIAAISRGDWVTAAKECAVQDPKLKGRYDALAQILLTGIA